MSAPCARPAKPGHRIEISWTWRSALQRSGVALRDRGVWAFLIKALGEMAYRRLLVLERDLGAPLPPVAAAIAATFGRLTEDEFAAYAEFRADTPLAEVHARLARGMDCFIARCDGRIACATWAARGSGWDAYLARAFDLDPSDVYLSDTITEPALRGRGLSPAVSAAIMQHFHERGCRRIILTLLPENRASRRARAKGGFVACGTLRTIWLGPWRLHLGSIGPPGGSP
jgi:RimJ/RimL family protein N-acetyltransferase